ncbi:MAG: ribonuclease HII [Candidatus Cloacimonetes bacterium]|nr:ribonuclease HII [Candidatus Cloacimonadota bacterium]
MKNKHLFDNDLLKKREYKILAGTDEAGRGPLAGPVVCASVILPDDFYHEDLNDSKKISEIKRDKLFTYIQNKAIAFSIEVVEAQTIDELNILNATLYGMKKSIESLSVKPDMVLIDGNKTPKHLSINSQTVVSGDAKHACIAAASILAKVTRDKIMNDYDQIYPQYGFAKHKGYPVSAHLKAIREYGICKIHRKSYKPVSQMTIKDIIVE